MAPANLPSHSEYYESDPVKEIRKGLKERRDAAAAERDRQAELVAMYDKLIAEEDRRSGIPVPSQSGDASPMVQGGLADLILAALKDKEGTVDLLKAIGHNWAALREADVPGRSINFALVGLQKRGLAEKQPNGVWRLTAEGRKRSEAPR